MKHSHVVNAESTDVDSLWRCDYQVVFASIKVEYMESA